MEKLHPKELKTAKDSEAKKMARVLWSDAVCTSFTYGAVSEDIDDHFGQTIKQHIESRGFPLFGQKKVVDVISAGQKITNNKGELVDAAVKSYRVESSGVKQVEGISITLSNDFALFLVRNGKKIDVEAWRRYAEVCWNVVMTDTNAELEFGSRNLNLLKEALSQKSK